MKGQALARVLLVIVLAIAITLIMSQQLLYV
jgi:hypothetical protein